MNRKAGLRGIDQRMGGDGFRRYRGRTWDKRARRHVVGPWTPSLEEAQSWRDRARLDVRDRKLTADHAPRLPVAIEAFLEGIESGQIRNRSGRVFKPSAVRGYRTALKRAGDYFGAVRLDRWTLPDLQLYVDYRARKAAPSTVHNDVIALRALYAWARRRHHGLGERDAFKGLLLPRGETARERIAAPAEMSLLVAALPDDDRALMAVAAYAGLRRGEGMALAREHVDLKARVIRVRRAWDPGSRSFVAPKTDAAVRDVPIVGRLAVILEDHLARMPEGRQLLFAGTRGSGASTRPMSEGAFLKRARKRWDDLELNPIGLHEARHTYASVAIAAGVNAKTLCTYMGHSSITVTFDRYGHLMPGSEIEALELMDAFLDPVQDLD